MSKHQPNQQHHRSEDAREFNQDFQVSLELAIDSEISYQQQQDFVGMSEIQASKAYAYMSLYDETKDENYLILAKYAVLSGLEIAQQSGVKEALAMPSFVLAKVYEKLDQDQEALAAYTQALDLIKNHPPKHQNRPAVKLDFELHLLLLQFKLGDKKLLNKILEIINNILTDKQESDYNKRVWASGGYLNLAEITRDKKYLKLAQEIINQDKRLVLRKEQLAKLENEI